jgi:hypothetical protein
VEGDTQIASSFFDFLLGEHSAFARGLQFSSRMACGLDAVMR